MNEAYLREKIAAQSANAGDYVEHLSPVGRRLMKKGWPGPVTLLFSVENPEKTAIHHRLAGLGREAIFGRVYFGFVAVVAVFVAVSSICRAESTWPMAMRTIDWYVSARASFGERSRTYCVCS